MCILSNGNVGIGTSNPTNKLDVNGNILVSENITQYGADLNIDNSVRRNGASGDRRRALVHNTYDRLYINFANDYTGNTTIDSPCDVNGTLTAGSTTINWPNVNLYIATQKTYGIYIASSSNETTHIIYDNSNATKYNIDKNWNILCSSINTNGGTINTKSITTNDFGDITCGKLISNTNVISAGGTDYNLAEDFVKTGAGSVTGITVTNDASVGGDLTVTGLTKSGTFQSNSDINLKTNIEPIHNALNAIQHIKGVHYNFKSNLDQKHTGLIAQDVEKILPHAVSKDDNGVRSLDYNSIIGLLVECVKDLKKENNEKTNIINKLSEDNRRISEDNHRISNDIHNIKKFLNIN